MSQSLKVAYCIIHNKFTEILLLTFLTEMETTLQST